jgi:protocatechuate 3,4-dioxygenase alpha subunit
MACKQTPSQTVGPFFSIGLDALNRADISVGMDQPDRLTFRGRILDGDGKPVPDAVIEIWQADPDGNYPDPAESAQPRTTAKFFGFGRVPTNDAGEFVFTTVKPGSVRGPDGQPHAPHLAISIFMRGLLQRLITRVYFPDEPLNDSDPVLACIPVERRPTLIAQRANNAPNELEWNIYLQGDQETVFLDC